VLRNKITAVSFFFVFCFLTLSANASVPDWLRSAAQQPVKKYADDVNAVTLLNETETSINDKGEIVRYGRVVYRILRPEGRDLANHSVNYDSNSKVNYLRGWSITSKGQEYEAKDLFERSVSSYEVYSDEKVKIIHVPGVDVGTVVGFEYEQKERPYIFQDIWDFQDRFPVESSRYELQLGVGWRFKADWINHEPLKPEEEGTALVWNVHDVPRIYREPHRPPSDALVARMVITFLSDKLPAESYQDWNEFGTWYSQLSAGVRDPSSALQQKVQELAPARLPVFERIKALARFAQQDVRYVEIQIGIGGWRPHNAGDIFSHRYGDCKDKATVLSTMLDQIGVKSYYLLVNTSRGIITESSPPQAYFDHMILAIALPQASYEKNLPALYNHPKLGPLLIFDPTNQFVPFGEIPSYEQDNYGLLVKSPGGDLIHLPLAPPEMNTLRRTAKLTLLADGTLQGEIDERLSGFPAMFSRMYLRDESQNDRTKMIEHFLGSDMTNFQVDSFQVENAGDIDKDLVLTYKFTASHYAKNAGSLLLVRPRVVGEMAGAFDSTKPRHYAYEFEAPFLRSDSVEITLPDGYGVDELPSPAHTVLPFAEYESKLENSGKILKYTREYKVETTQVPVDKVTQLRQIFSDINADERNMAVLKKLN